MVPTIKDVAKVCGVSVATVSRVVNNENNVKEETRKLVLQTIEKLNYVPNALGRSLRTDRSKTILVLLPGISNQFYSKVIVGMERRAEESGFKLVVGLTHNNPEIEQNFYESLKMHLYDGIITFHTSLQESFFEEISTQYPLLFCSESLPGFKLPYIGVDNEKAGYDITKYYIKKGIREIGFVGTALPYGSAMERKAGYQRALKEQGIPYNKKLIFEGDYTFESGIRAGNYFLSLEQTPKAVFAISDPMAAGVIHSFLDHHIQVGESTFVCGFDNTKLTEMVRPKMSTVSQPRFEIGYQAMDAIILKILEGKKIQGKKLKHKLIIRES